MIIKKISIENYLCYYGVNDFELSDGLNIILGENMEGKTKFFEAVDWVFNGDNGDLDKLVSAKKLEETTIGESFRVKVSITVNQLSEKKTISKYFIVKKINADDFSTTSLTVEGIEENKLGERNQVDGKSLLDTIFPFQIRKYSMFKGESQLNIFDNKKSLSNLIELFSDAKHYGKYLEKGRVFRARAESYLAEAVKLDKKKQSHYDQLESSIRELEKEVYRLSVSLKLTEEQIQKIEGELQTAAKYVKNADALDVINKRIKKIEDLIANLEAKIDDKFTIALFDQNWILVNFESIHHNFTKKITELSIERRRLQSEFDRQKGIKEGEAKAKADILNNLIPLPVGTPSKAHMEEMIKDEWCKVCDRSAPKDSAPYNFMVNRLKEYISSQTRNEEKATPEVQLYKNDYTKRLVNMSVKHEDNLKHLKDIRNNIKDWFEFNDITREKIEEHKRQLDIEKSERAKILGHSGMAEDKLIDVLKNYEGWQNDLRENNDEYKDINTKLNNARIRLNEAKQEKENIDLKSANLFLIRARDILRDIEIIFNDTKEMKFDNFIDMLEKKSNKFFTQINIYSFTGTIKFSKITSSSDIFVDIKLEQDGKPFYKPSESLLTSMHISILLAISELASEIKMENYPMIFDAPISSFGETKSAEFLNLIYETKNQKIVLIKDFISLDMNTDSLFIKKEFNNIKRNKAFWVKAERPFDPQKLYTLNTNVITL